MGFLFLGNLKRPSWAPHGSPGYVQRRDRSCRKSISILAFSITVLAGAEKEIGLAQECRSVSRENTDRFQARMVIGFR